MGFRVNGVIYRRSPRLKAHPMNRLNRATHHLFAVYTSATPLAGAGPRRFFRLNFASRSRSFRLYYHLRRMMEPISTTGADDVVHVDNKDENPEGRIENVAVDCDEADCDQDAGFTDRKVLPEELARSVVRLTCDSAADGGVCDVYLVGTAHVSSESCQEVLSVIEFLQPQVVFLELCSSRVAILKPQSLKVPTVQEMLEMWKKNQNPFAILYTWFLARVASKLEVFPGAEFRVAYEEAMKYGGKVILGDRPVQITLRRTWAKMSLWHKTKLLYSLLFQALFLPNPDDLNRMLKEMDDVDILTLTIQEMSKQFPTLMETIVHERDQYMSANLLRVACQHNSVVAVVGKGHLPGIQKNWKQPVVVQELLVLPSKKGMVTVSKLLATIGAAVAGAAVVSGIYMSLKK